MKKYKIGYVPGVFDLFHIGHLNLIRRSKEVSEYLIAGVLTDELVYHFKKRYPVIPFKERMEIVGAIKEVDEVVEVNFENTVKMDAWKKYHYDAYFSGNDHGSEWDEEKKQLREVGSDIVFFPYTKDTSTTQIRNKLKKESEKKSLYLFGAGIIGQNELQTVASGNEWQVQGFLDNSHEKHLTKIDNVVIYYPEDLFRLESENTDYFIKITMKNKEKAKFQLKELELLNRLVD